MKVSTFLAKDMREALQAVKKALGPDAVILSTRKIRERGKSGYALGQTMIEVTACPNPASQGMPRPDARPEPARPATVAPAYSAYDDEEEEEPFAPLEEEPPRRRSAETGNGYYPERPAPRGESAPSRRSPPEPELRAEPPPPRRLPPEPEVRAEPVSRRPPPDADSRYDPVPRRPLPEPEAPVSPLELSNIRDTLAHLEERVSSLPEVVARELQKRPSMPDLDAEGQRRYGWLIMHGVEEPIAKKLAMAERAGKERGLETVFKRFLKFNDPLAGEARVIVLVGPTGVGKTTTLAKMAADLILNRRRNVGLITLDTFRVGAVAQLETYAKLLQVRLVVARNPTELKAGMISLGRCDFILVDTVGTSPYNQKQVANTGELLEALGEKREVLLCLAGNVRETEQRAIFRRFQVLGPTGLAFTKLDETVTYGGMLNVALRAKLPLTVYTDGQRVPENLGWLTPERMATWFEQSGEMPPE